MMDTCQSKNIVWTIILKLSIEVNWAFKWFILFVWKAQQFAVIFFTFVFHLFPGWVLWLWQWRFTWSYWNVWDHDDTAERSITILSGTSVFKVNLTALNRIEVAHFALTFFLVVCSIAKQFYGHLKLSLLPFGRQAEFECINSKKKQKKKGYKNSGVVSVKLCQVLCFYLFSVS